MSSKPDRSNTETSFPDFDELMTLAMNDPDAFEEVRRQHIESFLNKVPQEKRKRLQGLQWKVDQIRKLANTPMAACITISNMMRDSLSRLSSEQLKLLSIGSPSVKTYSQVEPQQATILPFTRH